MILGTQMTCAIVIPTPEVFDCHAEGVKSMRWQMIDGQMVQAGGVSRTTTPQEVPAVPFAASSTRSSPAPGKPASPANRS